MNNSTTDLMQVYAFGIESMTAKQIVVRGIHGVALLALGNTVAAAPANTKVYLHVIGAL